MRRSWQPARKCYETTNGTGPTDWSSEMAATMLKIAPGERLTVHVPTFDLSAVGELEESYSLPAHGYLIVDDTPVFVEEWHSGGYKIRPDRKAAWCDALRSGASRQIHGLYQNGDGRCAMGMAYELASTSEENALIQWLGVSYSAFGVLCNTVIRMNDHEGKSFAEIADFIETAW